jgi:hypothetical protein
MRFSPRQAIKLTPPEQNQKPKTQMKKTTTLATVVAITLMGSAVCHAQDKAKQFEKLDADKNGAISLEEYKAKSKTPDTADAKFAKLDADKNGSVSLEEWSAVGAKKAKPAAPAAE